jgi:hypothetical protein
MLKTITGSPRELTLLREALAHATAAELTSRHAGEKANIAFTMFVTSHGVTDVCALKEITDVGVVVDIPDPPEGESDGA